MEEYVKSTPDLPEPGIIFRDVTSILQDADGLCLVVDSLIRVVEDLDYDVVIGPGSRGFTFRVSAAYVQHKSFVPVCKQGKLPCETISVDYELEYGTVTIKTHRDAIKPGQRVTIANDLIATGGATEATIRLIEQLGDMAVKIYFVMKLVGLNGREHLKNCDVDSAIIYERKWTSVCGYLQII